MGKSQVIDWGGEGGRVERLEHHLVILQRPCSRTRADDQSHFTLMGSGASWLCLVFWLGLMSEPAKERKGWSRSFSPLPLAVKAVILTWQEMDEVKLGHCARNLVI